MIVVGVAALTLFAFSTVALAGNGNAGNRGQAATGTRVGTRQNVTGTPLYKGIGGKGLQDGSCYNGTTTGMRPAGNANRGSAATGTRIGTGRNVTGTPLYKGIGGKGLQDGSCYN